MLEMKDFGKPDGYCTSLMVFLVCTQGLDRGFFEDAGGLGDECSKETTMSMRALENE